LTIVSAGNGNKYLGGTPRENIVCTGSWI